MRLGGLIRGVLAALVVAAATRGAIAQKPISFTILDELSPDEVAEDTTIYVNGERLGGFHLTREQPAAQVLAEIAAADHYEYVLCGLATTAAADGAREEHRVNDSGTIADPAGRRFSAYTNAYTAFFLVDVTPDRPRTAITIHAGPRCIGPIAAR